MSPTGSEDWQSTSCVLCATNCGLQVKVENNRITKVRTDKTNPVSQGHSCRKAMTVSKYADHKQRVTAPLKRMPDGNYTPISWERAISEIATKLNEIIDRNSPRSVALIGGGGQANHLDYLYASGFLKLIGSPWHFNALAQEFTQKYWVHGHMFGSEGLDFGGSLDSSEVFMVIGSNPWMSSGFQRARDLVKDIAKDPSRTLIVVDPRCHETAKKADLYLQIRPGTDPCWRSST
jgi:anaerobic selenocysteine-containing dehydrogenase